MHHEGCNKCAVSKGLRREHGGVRRCQMRDARKWTATAGSATFTSLAAPFRRPSSPRHDPAPGHHGVNKLNQHNDNQREVERKQKARPKERTNEQGVLIDRILIFVV